MIARLLNWEVRRIIRQTSRLAAHFLTNECCLLKFCNLRNSKTDYKVVVFCVSVVTHCNNSNRPGGTGGGGGGLKNSALLFNLVVFLYRYFIPKCSMK